MDLKHRSVVRAHCGFDLMYGKPHGDACEHSSWRYKEAMVGMKLEQVPGFTLRARVRKQ